MELVSELLSFVMTIMLVQPILVLSLQELANSIKFHATITTLALLIAATLF